MLCTIQITHRILIQQNRKDYGTEKKCVIVRIMEQKKKMWNCDFFCVYQTVHLLEFNFIQKLMQLNSDICDMCCHLTPPN